MENREWVMPTHIIAAAGIVMNDKDEILMVKTHNAGWVFPGGQVEVGKYPGYNGVKEIPTKIMLDFICKAKSGTPRPSEENSESAYVPKDKVLDLIQGPAYKERFKAYLEYAGRPTYLEYVTKPIFELRLKRLI